MRRRRERTKWHQVETIVVTGDAHLAMRSEAPADSVAAAEARIYDRARHLGTAVCVSFEPPPDLC